VVTPMALFTPVTSFRESLPIRNCNASMLTIPYTEELQIE